MSQLRLDSPLQYIKGVGPRKAEVLGKLNLHTVRDILSYYPRHYLDRTNIVRIADVKPDESVTIIGVVKAHGVLHGGGKRRYEVIMQDESGGISLLWFAGVKYWERMFKKGQIFAATGVVSYFQGHQMIHPELERLEDDSDRMVHAGRIIPVYPQTAELNKVGMNSRGIRRMTTFIFDNLTEKLTDPVPLRELEEASLVSLDEAIRQIHYPSDRDQVEASRRRLAFDELLDFQYLVFLNKSRKKTVVKARTYAQPKERLRRFKTLLPFELTNAQKKVIRELFEDLQTDRPMTRLLQGDVGCGKTVVAIAAALYAAENDLQVAFMAPTEILAEQHYRNWKATLEEVGVASALLTSSLKAADKQEVALRCKEGRLRLLFGTHALIYDYVEFERLGLVIIDEQHRFGVEQRAKLYAKGDNPDLLVMTATPIPRTLALTLYGDLDISTIDALPPGRKPVRTVWRSHDVAEKVYQFVRTEIEKGGQAYFVYPLIEKSDQIELQNVEDAFKELTAGPLAGLRVAMVHGRIKSGERDDILTRFRDGDLDILMATTVIEVGLDNPNATVMVIEHAERFGLAQLHQLRGRIGRGERQASLVAMAHYPISDIGRKRLDYLVSTTDGFKIAEADLELRGPGEIFGLRQSGVPELKVTRLSSDQDLIEAARALLGQLFSTEQDIGKEHRRLFNHLKQNASQRSTGLGGG